MQVFKAEVSNLRKHENLDVLVGVLFKFDEISKNYTMVRSGATVRATSDAILRRHQYPLASDFQNCLAGRILRYYTSEDGRYFLADFVVFDEAEKQKLLSGELAFSVAWIAELYDIRDEDYIAFDDVTIYETSIVDNPAFNTCAAKDTGSLTCMNSACGCKGRNSACGCGGKNAESGKKDEKESYISEMEQELMQAIQLLQEELKSLAERVSAIEAKLDAMAATEPVEPSVEVEQALNSVQAQVLKQSELYSKLEADFNKLLSAVSDFVEKATKQVRYA